MKKITKPIEVETRLIPIADAARRLGLSRATTNLLIEQGHLQIVTLNGMKRVRLQSVIDFSMGKETDYV